MIGNYETESGRVVSKMSVKCQGLWVDAFGRVLYFCCRTYVQRQKLWFVQYLTYPENCSQAVARLIRLIDGWQVWENGKDDIPEPPVRRSRQTSGKKRSEPVSPWMLLSN
ncbi:hypothetical protein [Phocaeicola barnesiae]|uniref:hypothetical protein n=1 Tax=Phocaeicola barnesiae TaxID=376804 RepID=UPI0025A40499|nr:hypothetical protein [Phocaeicola barnesiae]MDM8309072.1 hypothetical protein [Phocaeicola barnesiae]